MIDTRSGMLASIYNCIFSINRRYDTQNRISIASINSQTNPSQHKLTIITRRRRQSCQDVLSKVAIQRSWKGQIGTVVDLDQFCVHRFVYHPVDAITSPTTRREAILTNKMRTCKKYFSQHTVEFIQDILGPSLPLAIVEILHAQHMHRNGRRKVVPSLFG